MAGIFSRVRHLAIKMLLTIVIVITADTRKPETRKPETGLDVFTILHQLKFDHPVGRGFLPLSRLWRRRQEIRSHGEARSAFTFETKSSSLTCQLRT